MKKKLSIVTSAALLLVLGFTMAGCGKGVAKISPEFEGEHSISVSQATSFNTAATYVFGDTDGAGNVVVTETIVSTVAGVQDTVNYKVFDLKNNAFVSNITSATELRALDEGVFYSANMSIDYSTGVPIPKLDGTYNLYSTSGNHITGKKGAFTNGGHVFNADDGSRYYVNVDGEFTQESDPFAMILVNATTEKMGKYYVSETDSGFNVFDKKGKFKDAFNYAYTFNTTDGMSKIMSWDAGYNKFYQITTELPQYEEKYDLYMGDKKYNVDTYYYSIKSGKVKEVKNFDYWVEGVAKDIPANEEEPVDYAILNVKEIVDERVSDMTYVQSFNDKGKVYYDIQKLVPGATSLSYTKSGYTLVKDYANFTYIYEKDKCVLTIPAGNNGVQFASGDIVYYTAGTNLYIYDLDAKALATNVIENVESVNVNANGNIVYNVKNEVMGANGLSTTYTYYIYNVESGSAAQYETISDTRQKIDGSFSGSYVVIRNVSTVAGVAPTVTIRFPDSGVQDLTGTDVDFLANYEVDNTAYSIFTVASMSGGGYDMTTGQPIPATTIRNYYVGKEVNPIAKY